MLLKRARKETDSSVQTQLATALATNADEALPDVVKGLRTAYTKPTCTTYALALGFMTGTSIDALKNALVSGNENQRINASRAVAYMANVLSNPDAFAYTSDREFDIRLVKGLIAPLQALAQHESGEQKRYAEHALSQIEKLM